MMDWKTVELGEVCTLQRGMDLPKRLRTDGQFPLVTSSGIDGTHHIGPVKGPGVITGRYGTIGKVFYVESDFWPLNTTLYVRDFHGNDARFVHYLLQTVDFQSHSGKSGVPGVNRNDVHQEWVCVPANKSEQERISHALLDTDTLIESLEQLLTKKRQIKQGVMTELFSQRRRLPGFSDKWESIRIGEFTDCTAGGTPSTRVDQFWGGEIPWMSSGDLHQKRVHAVEGRITEEGLKNSSTKWIPERCVLIGLAGQGKTRGTVAMNLIRLCTNQSIAAIFPTEVYDPDFLYHNLDWRYEELRELSAGDGGRGGLNLTLIRSIIVPKPSLEEQRAVATVLTNMDADIIAVEARLTKTRSLKEAMAQALLTGRIRLVEPAA